LNEEKSMTIKRTIALACACALLLAASCGRGAGTGGGAKKLAFVTNNASDFWTIARRGCEKADAELPDATVEEIHDSYTFIPEDQPEELASLIREFLGDLQQDDHVHDERDREADRPTV
jgi:ABC-type sugar transport system substrate-binding protein